MIYHEFSKDHYLENVVCGNGYTIIVEAPLKKRMSMITENKLELNLTNDENIKNNNLL